MVLIKNLLCFHFFIVGLMGQENVFTIFQNQKTPFQSIKNKSSKSRKIEIFPKGLVRSFSLKLAIFPHIFFYFWPYTPRQCLLRYLLTKNDILGYKNKTFKKSKEKLRFFHGFGQKLAIFPIFSFQPYWLRPCVLRYSTTKKRLSRL